MYKLRERRGFSWFVARRSVECAICESEALEDVVRGCSPKAMSLEDRSNVNK